MTFQTHLKKKRSQYFKKNTKNRKCFYIIRDYLGENKIRAASDKSEKSESCCKNSENAKN